MIEQKKQTLDIKLFSGISELFQNKLFFSVKSFNQAMRLDLLTYQPISSFKKGNRG